MTRVEELTFTDDEGQVSHLTVTALGRLAYDQLVEQHPPRPDEQTLWNDVTFPPALIEACTGMDLGAAERLWHQAEVDDAEDVFETCLRLSGPGQWTWATWRIQRDPRLSLEMRLCNRAGISHDTFLAWSDRAQDLALAQMELSLDRCPGCGVRRPDMGNADAADVVQEACVHCELMAQMRAAIPDGERDRIHLSVVPVRS